MRPPIKERWFANLVLLSASVASVGAGLLALGTAHSFQVGMARLTLLVGGPFCLGAGFLACLRLPLPRRVTLAMTLISLVAAAYIAETYLRELPFLRLRLAAMATQRSRVERNSCEPQNPSPPKPFSITRPEFLHELARGCVKTHSWF